MTSHYDITESECRLKHGWRWTQKKKQLLFPLKKCFRFILELFDLDLALALYQMAQNLMQPQLKNWTPPLNQSLKRTLWSSDDLGLIHLCFTFTVRPTWSLRWDWGWLTRGCSRRISWLSLTVKQSDNLRRSQISSSSTGLNWTA